MVEKCDDGGYKKPRAVEATPGATPVTKPAVEGGTFFIFNHTTGCAQSYSISISILKLSFEGDLKNDDSFDDVYVEIVSPNISPSRSKTFSKKVQKVNFETSHVVSSELFETLMKSATVEEPQDLEVTFIVRKRSGTLLGVGSLNLNLLKDKEDEVDLYQSAGEKEKEPLNVGDMVFYDHWQFGPVLVEIAKVDHEGAFDGGETYSISSPKLASNVIETVRNRLLTQKVGYLRVSLSGLDDVYEAALFMSGFLKISMHKHGVPRPEKSKPELKKHWFVLDAANGLLLQYEDQNQNREIKRYDLSKAWNVKRDDDTPYQLSFTLRGEDHILVADTEEASKKWHRNIRIVVKREYDFELFD